MPSIVPIHYVNSFNSNVFLLSQQKESRLAPYARVESQKAEMDFYDYYDVATEPTERVNKYADLQAGETLRNRRMVGLRDYEKTEYVSHLDKLRMIHDPQAPISQAFQASFGRKMDRILIEALLGDVREGKTGQNTIQFLNTQRVVAHDGTTTTGVGLNVKTLRAVKKLFNKNEAIGDGEELIMAITSEEEDSMLGDNQLTSNDYAVVKALVNGSVDSFMGFRFIRTELLPITSTNTINYVVTSGVYGTGAGSIAGGKSRSCIAFVKGAVILAKAEDMVTKIDVLPTKGDVIQIFAKMSIGATRIEDKKVVQVVTAQP